jgi:hypothetical protein
MCAALQYVALLSRSGAIVYACIRGHSVLFRLCCSYTDVQCDDQMLPITPLMAYLRFPVTA